MASRSNNHKPVPSKKKKVKGKSMHPKSVRTN